MGTHWRGATPSLGKRWSGKDSRTSGTLTVGEDKELAWEFMGGKERKTRKEKAPRSGQRPAKALEGGKAKPQSGKLQTVQYG